MFALFRWSSMACCGRAICADSVWRSQLMAVGLRHDDYVLDDPARQRIDPFVDSTTRQGERMPQV